MAFILGPDETIEESPNALASQWLNQTREYWQDWIRGLAVPFDWQDAVIRAAITLKLCTYEDTGAVVAALTTSIPEIAGSERNWDYRFCWLRDSFFVVQALNRLGATRTMEAFLRYLDQTVAGSKPRDLQPLYGITAQARGRKRCREPRRVSRDGPGARRQSWRICSCNTMSMARSCSPPVSFFFDHRLSTMAGEAQFVRLEPLGRRPTRASKSRTPVPGSSAAANACTRFPASCAGRRSTAWKGSRATSVCKRGPPFGKREPRRCAIRS